MVKYNMKEYILDIKDFSLTRKLLEKNNIPIIPSHSKKQHSEILIKIDKRPINW